MQKRTQREQPSPQPLWQRTLGYVALLLVVFASVAQAAHTHGDWLPSTHTQPAVTHAGNSDSGEASCLLCVAMHSALPGVAVHAEVATALNAPVLASEPQRFVATRWHYDLFSRPPPISL